MLTPESDTKTPVEMSFNPKAHFENKSSGTGKGHRHVSHHLPREGGRHEHHSHHHHHHHHRHHRSARPKVIIKKAVATRIDVRHVLVFSGCFTFCCCIIYVIVKPYCTDVESALMQAVGFFGMCAAPMDFLVAFFETYDDHHTILQGVTTTRVIVLVVSVILTIIYSFTVDRCYFSDNSTQNVVVGLGIVDILASMVRIVLLRRNQFSYITKISLRRHRMGSTAPARKITGPHKKRRKRIREGVEAGASKLKDLVRSSHISKVGTNRNASRGESANV